MTHPEPTPATQWPSWSTRIQATMVVVAALILMATLYFTAFGEYFAE